MPRSFVTRTLGAIVVAAILTGSAWILPALASEYHNPAVNGKDSPQYWLDRGGLLATYGNYAEAIKAYNKALALDPSISVIYYDLALAYCEIGNFEQAEVAIDRALTMSPDNGQYYYGRGWIMLQAHGAEQAKADFQKAADLGNPNALDYLRGKGKKPAPGH